MMNLPFCPVKKCHLSENHSGEHTTIVIVAKHCSILLLFFLSPHSANMKKWVYDLQR